MILSTELETDCTEGRLSLHSQHTDSETCWYTHHCQSDSAYQWSETYKDGEDCQLLLQQSHCTVGSGAEE